MKTLLNSLLLMFALISGNVYADATRFVELQMAAEQGVAKEQNNLGVMYDNATGVTKDNTQAVY